MSVLQSLKEVLHGRRVRRATLPWDELEAEAARERCSPADIFFDRAGDGDAGEPDGGPPAAPAADAGESEADERRVPWRGLDPRPAPSPVESHR